MTSKERIIAALKRKDVDYTPCAPVWWSQGKEGFEWARGSKEKYLEKVVNELGLDTFLSFSIPPSYYSGITQKTWIEHPLGEEYPLIYKEIDTPKGKLKAIIRQTDDYPYGKEIPFMDDFIVSRYIKPWVESIEDVEKFGYVYLPPRNKTLKKAKERFLKLQKLAEKWQIPIIGSAGMSLNSAIHLMGVEKAIISSIDNPEIINRLLEIIHSTNRKILEAMLSWGVKIVIRNGWYDTTDFWSPEQYKKWVMPQLKKDIDLAHSADSIFIYQACTGIKPLIPFLKELNFDCLLEVEPVLGHLSMREIKEELGDKKSFWGGISAPEHIGRGTPDEVRKAVRKAFSDFGHRGFILKVVPSIRSIWPWENVLAMIDEWKKIR